MKASLVIVALLLILVPIREDALCLEQNPGEILAQTSQSSFEENARGVVENELDMVVGLPPLALQPKGLISNSPTK